MINCVNLAYCKVSSLSNLDFFAENFPFMSELDLEGNLIDSWSFIFTILNNLKSIKIINVR